MHEQPWPLEWMAAFLLHLRTNANVRGSCEAAGVSRVAAYKARKQYARFRDAWDEALEDAVDRLEAVAWARAQAQSDFLLWRLLASLRRERYADKVDVTINVQQQAAELAEKYGLDVKDILATAEEIVAGAKRG